MTSGTPVWVTIVVAIVVAALALIGAVYAPRKNAKVREDDRKVESTRHTELLASRATELAQAEQRRLDEQAEAKAVRDEERTREEARRTADEARANAKLRAEVERSEHLRREERARDDARWSDERGRIATEVERERLEQITREIYYAAAGPLVELSDIGKEVASVPKPGPLNRERLEHSRGKLARAVPRLSVVGGETGDVVVRQVQTAIFFVRRLSEAAWPNDQEEPDRDALAERLAGAGRRAGSACDDAVSLLREYVGDGKPLYPPDHLPAHPLIAEPVAPETDIARD